MSKKILLADDSITIQKVVELTFSDGDYEVIATSNGTRAIEEIPKVKPDIILSDIIMPEKNGYELCEWVKSHPEYRHIPVILLTGTFEPFDPDRAEKAGCDAVVTKPFESQSLIQKVEELIARAGEGPAAPGAAAPSDEPFAAGDDNDDAVPPPFSPPQQPETMAESAPGMNAPPSPPPLPEPSSFEMGQSDSSESSPFEGNESSSFQPEAESAPFPPDEEEPRPQGDIFGEQAGPDSEDDPAATRIIPRMSMEDIERIRQERQDEQPESDEVPPPPSFEDAAPPIEMDSGSEEEPEPEPMATPSFDDDSESSPFGAQPERSPMEDDATRMIPKMSMEEIQRFQQEAQQDETQEPESSPFGDDAADEAAEDDSPFAAPAPPAEMPSPDFEAPGFDQETQKEETTEDFDDSSTRMIPKMAFEDIQRMQQEEEEPDQTDDASEQQESPVFGMGAPSPADDSAAANPFANDAESDESSEADEQPASFSDEREPGSFDEQEELATSDQEDSEVSFGEDEAPAPFAEEPPELLPPPPHPPEQPVMQEPEPEATAGTVRADEPASSGALSEEQIDTIARRVVELLSDKVIREIAWEVIPETAEMIVRERIKELEGEER